MNTYIFSDPGMRENDMDAIRARVQRVRRMRHERRETVGLQMFAQRKGVVGVDGLRISPAGIAREERERVGLDRGSFAAHVGKSLRC